MDYDRWNYNPAEIEIAQKRKQYELEAKERAFEKKINERADRAIKEMEKRETVKRGW